MILLVKIRSESFITRISTIPLLRKKSKLKFKENGLDGVQYACKWRVWLEIHFKY